MDNSFNFDIRKELGIGGFVDGRTTAITGEDIEALFADGLSGINTAATRAMYGFNHLNNGLALPANYDLNGYTFFTRPRMCLLDSNIVHNRKLSHLLVDNPVSIPRAIRAILDPIGSGSIANFTVHDMRVPKDKDKYVSPLVNKYSPFISILSNTLVSMSGWPDINVDTYQSEQGIAHERWAMYDGVSEYMDTFDLNTTFTNMRGDPLGTLFHSWVTSALTAKKDEKWLPWLDSIMDDEKDFETRIYRMVMDPSKRFIQKIAYCGAAFPTATNSGSSFDFDSTKPLNSNNDTVSMSWKCQGAFYYDMYAGPAFNITVVDWNPNMHPTNRARVYTKIPPNLKPFFKDEGYPWINLDTSELEWYVSNDRYLQVSNYVKSIYGG